MNTNELRTWAENHDIEKKTINGFWFLKYIMKWKKISPSLKGALLRAN